MRKMFFLGTLAVGFFLTVYLLFATESPHYLSYEVQCASCHIAHSALGNPLANAATNALVCQQCHNPTSYFSMLETSNITEPGSKGTTHRWFAEATNPQYGATEPANADMKARMAGTRITCSTCHDQHETNNWGTLYRRSVTQTADAGAAGPAKGVIYQAVDTANPKTYLIEIIEAGGAAGAAKYRLSNDNGRTWLGWDGANWVSYTPGNARTTSITPAYQDLNDAPSTNAQVTFDTSGGNFDIGDRYRFYVSYPFLRATLDSGDNTAGSKFCRDCHSARAHTYTDARTYTGTNRSHPVGQALNANSANYDRSEPLDVNGQAQSVSADTNPTNNLMLVSGDVQCLTCHGVHYTDSNSASVDR